MHAVRLGLILVVWFSFHILTTIIIVPEAFSQIQCQTNGIGRWEATFDWTFSNCSGAGHYLTRHTYAVTQSGNSLRGSSLEAPAATINGTASGNAVNLTLIESFSGGCARSFTLAGTVNSCQITGSVSGGDDNCGTCQINGTFGMGVTAPVPCHLYYPGAAIPDGFGVPWNVFNPSELELKAFCTNTSVTADVGPGSSTRIIHTQGYQLNTATNQWEKFTYTCDAPLMSGVWCPGNAAADLNPTHPSFLANTCSWVNNAWQCGCRDQACTQNFWQLQAFQAPSSSTTTLVGTWTGTWQSLIVGRGGGSLTLSIVSANQSLPGSFQWMGTLTMTGPARSTIAEMPVRGEAYFCQAGSFCLGNSFIFWGTPPGEFSGCQPTFAAGEGTGAQVSLTRVEGGIYEISSLCRSLDVDAGNFTLQKQ